MCCTNLRIERTAAVQIMVDTVQSGIFQDSCLLLCQEADGAADLCIFLLHLADTVCKIFNLLVWESDSTQSDTMSCKMFLIYQVIISIKLFIWYSLVLLNLCLRILRLCTISAVLCTVSTTNICQKLNAYFLPFVFCTKCISTLHQTVHLLLWKIQHFNCFFSCKRTFFIPVFQ